MTTGTGFSDAERAAMKERAKELRAEKGGRRKADDLQAALDAIAGMPDDQRDIAETDPRDRHAGGPGPVPQDLVRPAGVRPRKGRRVLFMWAAKFDSRYNELGFNDVASCLASLAVGGRVQ